MLRNCYGRPLSDYCSSGAEGTVNSAGVAAKQRVQTYEGLGRLNTHQIGAQSGLSKAEVPTKGKTLLVFPNFLQCHSAEIGWLLPSKARSLSVYVVVFAGTPGPQIARLAAALVSWPRRSAWYSPLFRSPCAS